MKIVITIKGGLPEKVEADQPGTVEVWTTSKSGNPLRPWAFTLSP